MDRGDSSTGDDRTLVILDDAGDGGSGHALRVRAVNRQQRGEHQERNGPTKQEHRESQQTRH